MAASPITFPGRDGDLGGLQPGRHGGGPRGGHPRPINGIIILFEMTGSYRIILPLMLSCIIAAVLSGQIRRESIYTLKPTAGAWTSARAAR